MSSKQYSFKENPWVLYASAIEHTFVPLIKRHVDVLVHYEIYPEVYIMLHVYVSTQACLLLLIQVTEANRFTGS